MPPYIGISAVTTIDQSISALGVVPLKPRHKLMIGTAQSHKSLQGLPLNPPWDKRVIPADQLHNVFLNDPNGRLLNIIHYADDDFTHLFNDLTSLVNLCEPPGHISHLHGFQLNVPIDLTDRQAIRQAIASIDKFASTYPWAYLILNLFPPTLRSVNYNPRRLSLAISPLLLHLNAVLLDSSGGQGKNFDPQSTLALFEAIHNIPIPPDFTPIHIGVAGNLGPDTTDVLDIFEAYFPIISTDSESAIRTDNKMDMHKVRTYLTKLFTKLG